MRALRKPPPPPAVLEPAGMPQERSGSVLVVEDDPAMRDLLTEELSDAGFDVEAAPHRGGGPGARAGHPVRSDHHRPADAGDGRLRPDPRRDAAARAASRRHDHRVRVDRDRDPGGQARRLRLHRQAVRDRGAAAGRRQGARRARAAPQGRPAAARGRGAVRPGNIIAKSSAMRDVVALVQRIAGSTASVLVTGESGTGKELIARAIHYNSPRASGPFVGVNLAAVPEGLIESELFGHKRGAFTDARADKPGLFVEADAGTIFLDEIGELALPLQAKLLRVLQEHEVRPLGATRNQRVDVRDRRGDQPQPRDHARRRQLPRGPVLPAQRHPPRPAAAAGPPRGHRAARPARARPARRAADPAAPDAAVARGPAPAARLPLAGQRARADERPRARRRAVPGRADRRRGPAAARPREAPRRLPRAPRSPAG